MEIRRFKGRERESEGEGNEGNWNERIRGGRARRRSVMSPPQMEQQT